MKDTRDRREIIARALCRHDWQAENKLVDGKPMWASYLSAADTVLNALNGIEAGERPSEGDIIALSHQGVERQQ